MRPLSKVILSILLFVILLITVVSLQWIEFTRKPLPVPPEGIVIDYYSGDSVLKFAKKMEEKKLIKHAWFFVVLVRMEGVDKQLQAGQYLISPHTTSQRLLQMLTKGEMVQQVFRIGEGWTVKQVIEEVNKSDHFKHSEPALTVAHIQQQLGLKEASLEGWLFPDTYFLALDAQDIQLFKRAYAKMQKVLQEEWMQRAPNLPYKTPEEALTMASIIEKETGAPSERSQVAGVFVRRLEKNMLLQADPTVIYGLQENYQGKLTKENLTTPTAHNTYVKPGLPATPICLPGRAAIHAALHPDNSSSLYFVAKGDGTHEFSSNLESHNNAVKKYQLQKTQSTTSTP